MAYIKIKEEFFKDYLKVEKQLKALNPKYEHVDFEIMFRDECFLLVPTIPDDLMRSYILDLYKEPLLFEKIKVF